MPKIVTKKVRNIYDEVGTDKNFPDFSNVPLYLLDGPATSFI